MTKPFDFYDDIPVREVDENDPELTLAEFIESVRGWQDAGNASQLAKAHGISRQRVWQIVGDRSDIERVKFLGQYVFEWMGASSAILESRRRGPGGQKAES